MDSPSEYRARSLHVTLLTPFDSVTETVLIDELASTAKVLCAPNYGERLTPIVNAEAGEIYTLDREERRSNVRTVIGALGDSPVIAGVVGRTAKEAVQCAEDALADGASGLFVLPPYGSSDITTCWDAAMYPSVVVDYLAAISRAVGPDVPFIIHPSGSRTPEYGLGWPLPVLERVLEAVPNIAGWKMIYTYEGFRRVARYLQEEAPQVAILPSSAVRYHENLAAGQFDGACSGSFCYAQDLMLRHIAAWRRADVDDANAVWQGGLARLHEYVYSDYARLHTRYKLGAYLTGAISSAAMRGPFVAATREEIRTMRVLLGAAGVETVPHE